MHREGNSSPQPLAPTLAGQGHNPPGQAGKVIGAPQAQAYIALPGGQYNLPGGQPHPHTPSRSNQGSSNEEPNPKWVINLSNKTFDTSSKVCSG